MHSKWVELSKMINLHALVLCPSLLATASTMSHCQLSWGREQQFSYNAAFTAARPNKNAVFLPKSIFSSMQPWIGADCLFAKLRFQLNWIMTEAKLKWLPATQDMRLHRRQKENSWQVKSITELQSDACRAAGCKCALRFNCRVVQVARPTISLLPTRTNLHKKHTFCNRWNIWAALVVSKVKLHDLVFWVQKWFL